MLRRSCAWLYPVVTRAADGAILDGEFQGDILVNGIVKLKDGRVFKGEYNVEDGGSPTKPGVAVQLEEDGDLYKGLFNKNWQRHGQGKAWLLDGTHFNGRFQEDEFVEGVAEIPKGSFKMIFTGKLKDEAPFEGTLKSKTWEYTGFFKNSHPHGKGRLEFDNGSYQEGNYHAGSLQGEGMMKLVNGHVLKGDFVGGKIRRGTLLAGVANYEGEFDDHNRPHGAGRLEALNVHPKIIQEGRWQHGILTHGTSKDEFGEPVDYYNDERSKKIGGKGGTDTNFFLEFVKHFEEEKIKATEQQDREYHQAATDQFHQGGRYPTKAETGHDDNQAAADALKLQSTQYRKESRVRSVDRMHATKDAVTSGTVEVEAEGNIKEFFSPPTSSQ